MKILVSFSAALLLTLSVVEVSHANHIDFIEDGNFFLSTTSDAGPGTAAPTGDAGNILGEEREVMIEFPAGGSGILSTGTVNYPTASPGTVALLFDNSVGAKGIFTLTYDGIGNVGLGAQAFSPTYKSVLVDVPEIQGEGTLTVEYEDSFTNAGSLTKVVTEAKSFAFPFNDPGYTGVDFGSIERVTVKFVTTVAATDLAISQIIRADRETDQLIIPEPASWALGLLGLCGFVMRRNYS